MSRISAINRCGQRTICGLLIVCLAGTLSLQNLQAQTPATIHNFHRANLPPGTVGQGQILRDRSLLNHFQAVEINVPAQAFVALAVDGRFERPQRGSVKAGLLVGQVYRVQISNIPFYEGLEVYPTIEIVNRLHPPAGQEFHFPVPIHFTQEDLELALDNQFVTRVVALENPREATPIADDPKDQRYFDVAPHEDPLLVADQRGKPMAITRMGSRIPDYDAVSNAFLFGMPPLLKFIPDANPAESKPAVNPEAAIDRQQRNVPRLPIGQPNFHNVLIPSGPRR